MCIDVNVRRSYRIFLKVDTLDNLDFFSPRTWIDTFSELKRTGSSSKISPAESLKSEAPGTGAGGNFLYYTLSRSLDSEAKENVKLCSTKVRVFCLEMSNFGMGKQIDLL